MKVSDLMKNPKTEDVWITLKAMNNEMGTLAYT